MAASVITAVLAIGMFNLALGFALAVLLEGSPRLAWARGLRSRVRSATGMTNTATTDSTSPLGEADSIKQPRTGVANQEDSRGISPDDGNASAGTEEPYHQWLPLSFLHLLQKQTNRPRTFAESVMWVIRTSLPGCRQSVVDACRDYEFDGSTQAARNLITSVKDWHAEACEWARVLRENRESTGYSDMRAELHSLLADHAGKLRALYEAIEKSDPHGELLIDRKEMLRLMDDLIQTADTVGEHVDEALSKVLSLERRLADSSEQLQIDPQSQLLNRLGLAVLVDDWLAQDPDQLRLVSGVMIDFDNVRALNESLGPTATDAVLRAAGELLKSVIRKQRGYDRVARITAQKFFLFYGDTGIRNGMNGAERVRQNFQSTTFKVGDVPISLTTCCAVAEWGKGESLEAWMQRLQDLIGEAKRSGRNRTCVGEENGSRLVATNQYQIPPREIVVEVADARTVQQELAQVNHDSNGN